MEYMMIRSVKSAAAGTSSSDLQKSTLGLISGGSGSASSNHHNNLYQNHHHHGSTSTFSQGPSPGSVASAGGVSHTQHQQQYNSTTYPQNNSYDIKLFSQFQQPSGGDSRCWNLDNTGLTSSLPTNLDAFGASQSLRKKTPTLLPVVIKSKETLDRIANTRRLQNSTPGLVSGGSGGNSNAIKYSASNVGVYSDSQQHSFSNSHLQSHRNGLFGVTVSPHCSKPVSKKMSKFLWESSHQKLRTSSSNDLSVNVSLSDGDSSRRKRKQPEADISSLFGGTKKQKLGKESALHMPNLLKTLSSGGKSGDETQRTTSDNSLASLVNSFRSPSSSALPARTGIPIENIFLKKYDPIRLLKRLRCNTSRKTTTAAIVKNLVAPKKRKVVTVNNFPIVGIRREYRGHKSNEVSKRRKKRKKNVTQQSKIWTLGGTQVTSGQIGEQSKGVSLPKYFTPKRKVHVKYWSPVGDNYYNTLSEDRLRVIAAVYLKRALTRVRQGGNVKKSSIKTRLKKLKAMKRRRCGIKNNSQAQEAIVKGNKVVSRRLGPLVKFHVTSSSLPPPIPIETHPFSLVENPQLMHTLQLLRHKRELQDRLETFESDGSVQKVGPLPEKPEEETKIPFLPENTPLKRRQVKHVISQKLLICLSTVGFTHTKLRPLEVMADATSSFLTKMAQRLKEVSEMEMYGVDHGFPDTMERVLIEQGLGGIRGLEEFYRTKVVDYGQRMEEQCLLLRRQYAYKVRSKVGMMSNVNTSSISALSSSSSPSVTTISTPPSSSVTGNHSSTATLAPQSVMVVSGGGGGNNTTATVAVASKSTLMAKTSSSSSQPLSPGNSVLAEMLSSQEDLSVRTPQASPSPGMMVGSSGPVERQLEELMGAPPPNVEIRPNSFPHPHHPHQHRQAQLVQQQQQQVPLHHLLASLSHQQQSPQSRQQQPLLPPPSPQQQQTINPYVNTLYASSPPLTPPTPPHHLSQKVYQQQQHQASPQGQPQNQQSQLTQLLQRPVSSQPAPTIHSGGSSTHQVQSHHHLILHHHHPQQPPPPPPQQGSQYHHPLHASHLTSSSQLSPIRNTNINTTTITASKSSPHHPSQVNHHPGPAPAVHQVSRQLGQAPLQLNLSKVPGHLSSLASGETTYSSNTTPPSSTPRSATTSSNGTPSPSNNNSNMQAGGKLITLIRSSTTGVNPQQGILVNSSHNHNYQDSSLSTGVSQDSVISINLGGHADVDAGGDIGTSPTASSTSATSKAKLKEAISQRNLLRLNFEQVPSGAGDSTVLLSSSSVASSSAPSSVANTNNSVQFLGKVSGSAAGGGQVVSWNNTTNYS